jgi:diguanylate cyclase (GGDEF)-like protein
MRETDLSVIPDVSLADRALELLPHPTVIVDGALRAHVVNESARVRFGTPSEVEDPAPTLEDVLSGSDRLSAETRERLLSCCAALIGDGQARDRQEAVVAAEPGHTIALHVRMLAGDRWLVVLEDRRGRTDPGAILDETRRDPLTELGNGRHIAQQVTEALDDDDPDNRPAVLVFDVDQFDDVRARLGKAGGDALLRAIAGRLRRATRVADQLAHIEGHRFAVLQHNGLGADNLAVRLVDLLGRPYLIRGEVATVGISVGIARAPGGGMTADMLLSNADLARREAKDAGGHTWRRFGQTLAERARSRLDLESDLRRAIGARQLTLAYQPKVNLRTRAITGFEALARWSHPRRGAVPPALFIPVAEDIGLISAWGECALRLACHDAAAWPDPLTVAVNISGRQLDEGQTLVNQVLEALRASGLPPRRLELEITEHALLRRPDEARAVLRELHDLGIRIVMDNFGSGHSSLRQLRACPFDTIKIDQSFIHSLTNNEESSAIVRSIAILGTGLGMAVLAEGVETRGQARMVAAGGCTDVQGFLLSEPVAVGKVPSVLARGVARQLADE